jgi:hypothetical protein
MAEESAPPIGGISGAEAAEVLGLASELYVSRLIKEGITTKAIHGQRYGLERTEVERVALERWQPGKPYWTTSATAAELLALTQTRVRQLVDQGSLPALQHDGRWFFRRHQVEVIANAREARKIRGTLGRRA